MTASGGMGGGGGVGAGQDFTMYIWGKLKKKILVKFGPFVLEN